MTDFDQIDGEEAPTRRDILWLDAGLALCAVTVGLALYGGWTLISGWL